MEKDVKESGRGYYCVNPRYVFRGSQSKRSELVDKLIKSKFLAGESIASLTGVPDSEFLSAN